tara:strand:- start:426 stop:1250 length:825 start_codon:yes stop_codon:yes gene_type:complete
MDWKDALYGTEVKSLEHGAVHDAVQEMANKLGLGRIKVTVSNSTFPGARAIPYRDGTKEVCLDKGIIDATKSSLHGHVTPELKAIIGHELGHHARDIYKNRRMAKLPLYVGPIAAVGVYQAAKAFRQAHCKEEPCKDISFPRTTLIGKTFGLNAQMASWGLFGGMIASAITSRHQEFECDRIGASLTTPEAMKNAINIIYDNSGEAISELKAQYPQAHKYQWLSPETWRRSFAAASYDAHPFKFERIRKLEKMASEVSQVAHEGRIVETLLRAI